MPLIDGRLLQRRFREHLTQATHVDIAVAWARPCEAVNALKESSRNTKIRIVVGVSGYITLPSTLQHLKEFAELRIAPYTPQRTFHPKYYCFHGPERTICWVGSANLTRRGFGINTELVHEFDVNCEEERKWFERIWADLVPNPWPAIEAYKDRFESELRNNPPRRPPRSKKIDAEPELLSLAEVAQWDDFVKGLRALDDYRDYHYEDSWDVLGETDSYLHTIERGGDLVRLEDWMKLSELDCDILRGLERTSSSGCGRWGLLGTVRGSASHVFTPRRMPKVGPVREQIREQVELVLNATPDEIANVSHGAMETIRNLRVENAAYRIGHAAATRWLTLARPDRLVSVNKESAAKLGKFSGLPKTPDRLADNYKALLNWVYAQPWFDHQKPDDPLEQDIWNYRAALLDAFVYASRQR